MRKFSATFEETIVEITAAILKEIIALPPDGCDERKEKLNLLYQSLKKSHWKLKATELELQCILPNLEKKKKNNGPMKAQDLALRM